MRVKFLIPLRPQCPVQSQSFNSPASAIAAAGSQRMLLKQNKGSIPSFCYRLQVPLGDEPGYSTYQNWVWPLMARFMAARSLTKR